MQLNKSKKSNSRQSSNNLFDNDFASGFEDSKFDRFRPALKALIAVIVLVGVAWGAVAYFGGTDTENGTNKSYVSDTSEQDDDKLAQCTIDMEAKNPIPEAEDGNFYPKLIAYYDAQIDCYDQYPNASSVVSKSSLELARDNALDSSGSYKDTYVSFGSSSGSSESTKNNVTGCDYSLSESEYLACSDKYYAAHGSSSSSSSSSPSSSTNTPPTTPPAPTSPPSNTGGGSSSGGSEQSDPYVALNACLAEARSLPTEASRARAVQGCYQNHTP